MNNVAATVNDTTLILGMSPFEIIYIGFLILTIIAIFFGPIKAVKITRKMDKERDIRERKLEVFRSLMKTRRIRLSSEHVTALNLIELEFYKKTLVTKPYREYIKHLSSPLPASDQQEHYFTERDDLFVNLLQGLGEELGYNFDKKDLDRLSYTPVGWEQDESTQKKNARLLSELLEGKRPLPITSMQVTNNSPFPPPPEIGEKNK